MRRTAAVFLSALALVAMTLPAASADTTTVARSIAVDAATASGVMLGDANCSTAVVPAAIPAPLTKILDTPLDSGLPAATRIWAIKPSGSGNSYGPMVKVANHSFLGVFSLDVYNATSGQVVVWYLNADGSGWVGRSTFTQSALTWATVSGGAGRSYTWTPFNSSHEITGPTSTGNVDTFWAARGHEPAGGWIAGVEAGCDGKAVGWQRLVYGDTPGDLTIVDYEALTNNVVSKPSASFVSTSGAVTIGGSAQYGGPSSATLSFRDATMSSYATAGSASTAGSLLDLTCSGGVCRDPFAGVVLHPKYNVVYRWCYGSDVEVGAACGTFATIHVQAVIAATFPSSISAGHGFTVSGKVTPLRPGTLVGLWAKNGSTTVRIGTGNVSTTGTFSINATLGSGTWTIWLTTANDKLNAAGKSVSRMYSVH